MGLEYPGRWKFEGCGIKIPNEASEDFYELVIQIAYGKQNIVEAFKTAFGDSSESSGYNWALTDLKSLFTKKLDNAALFIDCFWSGVERAKNMEVAVPDEISINRILFAHNVPLQIQDDNLIETTAGIVDPATISSSKGNTISYILEEELGRGGFGVVHRAIKETTVSSFEFALKILDPSPFVSDYDKALKRFKREVVALTTMQHRSIVQIVEGGLTVDNKPYIVMPLIKGKNLRDAVVGYEIDELVKIFIEVLSGLKHAHDHNIIHRDLKPNNILVRESDSQPIILDFGAAFVLDQQTSKSLTTQFTGTIGYIPSEVLADPKRRSHLHDVYSCGIMLYECIAHSLPDPANYKPLIDLDNKYKDLDAVIKNAIAGENIRTQSAELMITELNRLI